LHAQALPDEVRNAGITPIQGKSVQMEVKRSVAEQHVSEQALAVFCANMGVQLARGDHFDLNQMISLISGRADGITALYQRPSPAACPAEDPAGRLLGKTDQASRARESRPSSHSRARSPRRCKARCGAACAAQGAARLLGGDQLRQLGWPADLVLGGSLEH
jgi:hypothetical protein